MPERYDTIGRVYARHRAADPRIASQIERGTGDRPATVRECRARAPVSYEPRDRVVTAVEPSTVMIEQRATGRRAGGRARSRKTLPFAADTFDVALATFTVHHWTDAGRRAPGAASASRGDR